MTAKLEVYSTEDSEEPGFAAVRSLKVPQSNVQSPKSVLSLSASQHLGVSAFQPLTMSAFIILHSSFCIPPSGPFICVYLCHPRSIASSLWL